MMQSRKLVILTLLEMLHKRISLATKNDVNLDREIQVWDEMTILIYNWLLVEDSELDTQKLLISIHYACCKVIEDNLLWEKFGKSTQTEFKKFAKLTTSLAKALKKS